MGGESTYAQSDHFPNETFSCLMASSNFSLLIPKSFWNRTQNFLKEMLCHNWTLSILITVSNWNILFIQNKLNLICLETRIPSSLPDNSFYKKI